MKPHVPFELNDPVSPIDHAAGPTHAPVTVVEYGDFECPNCKQAQPAVKLLLERFAGRVQVAFRHFPLEDVHPHALRAAEAAESAGGQGKFWEMHDLLYKGFPDLSRRTVMSYAKQIGLDMNRFTTDLDSHKFRARVRSEEQEGEVAGVGGTPTFFINGKKYNGVFEVASVVPLIKKEMK